MTGSIAYCVLPVKFYPLPTQINLSLIGRDTALSFQSVIRILVTVSPLPFRILAVGVNPQRDVRPAVPGLLADVMERNAIVHAMCM